MILSTNIQTSVAYYWENVQGTSCARQLKHGWPDLKWHFAFFRRQRSLGSIVLARFGIHYNIFIVRYKKDKEPTLPSSRYSGPFLFCTRFTRLNLCMSVQGTHARNAKPEEDCGVKKSLRETFFVPPPGYYKRDHIHQVLPFRGITSLGCEASTTSGSVTGPTFSNSVSGVSSSSLSSITVIVISSL